MLLGLLDGLAIASGWISIDRAIDVGAALGRIWFRLGGPRSVVVRTQLRAAFPDETEARREVWARDVFVHLGMGLAEVILLRGRHRAALIDRVRFEGVEHVEAVLRARPPRGAMVVTGHLGNWELACARIAASGIPVSIVYRKSGYPGLDRALLGLRRAGATGAGDPGDEKAMELIPMGRAAISILRALRKGRLVLVLLDQNARRDEGIFVSFFGRPACTRSGPLLLASHGQAPVLFGFMRRNSDGRTHALRVGPPLDLEADPSDAARALRSNLQQVTDLLEKVIREEPGQWIWTHRRWRTQPASSSLDSGPELDSSPDR